MKSDPAVFRRSLLKWFSRAARDLPWRRTKDPYAIWVSEMMLQQTRVETVIPYYRRFMKRFPTVVRLARARHDSLLRMWQGLGYYRRAKHMHETARHVLREWQGAFPHDPAVLVRLPGFGAYTTAAFLSIIHRKPLPAIDGNVIRVMSRVLAIRSYPDRVVIDRVIRPALVKLISRRSPGNFNQALMELGATICRPTHADCPRCPVRKHCRAYGTMTNPAMLPVKKRPLRRKRPLVIAVGVIRRGDRTLILKRPEEKILGGLWEFPGGKVHLGEEPSDACIREVLEETGLEVAVKGKIIDFVHHYSHYSVHLHFFDCVVLRGKCRPQEPFRWVQKAGFEKYAFPAANARVIRLISSNSPAAKRRRKSLGLGSRT